MAEQFTAYISKYALSGGIKEVAVEDCFRSAPNMVCEVQNRWQTYHGDDWHRTRAAAEAKAEDMRVKKIASLKKQITKLEAMRFTTPEAPDGE